MAAGMAKGVEPELVGTKGVERIARDQAAVAERKKALRQSARRATNALAKIGQNQVVLGHIQPRWLRAKVEQLLDAGEEVSFERLAELKAAGR